MCLRMKKYTMHVCFMSTLLTDLLMFYDFVTGQLF